MKKSNELINRDSFLFYRKIKELIATLPDDERVDVYDAVLDYSLDFTEPNLTGDAKEIWKQIKPILDRDIKKWQKRHLF